ncbi:MAG TPA: DUF885 domain-containing protein [Terriglobales bacterium]|nr:DUF885 domain-containing protein [Terriglobales bacterium]
MRLFALLLLLVCLGSALAQEKDSPEALRRTASDYYNWRNQQYPVNASDQGLHTWDDRLTDYSPAAIAARRQHVREVLAGVNRLQTTSWNQDDRIDWVLFRAQLEQDQAFDRILHPDDSNPQLYVNECSNAIFSLLKKNYDTPQKRVRSAASRLRQMPDLLRQARENLKHPVQLNAKLAISSARAIDPLFKESLMTLAGELAVEDTRALVAARDSALAAIHAFADELERELPQMVAWSPMGEENYNYLLHHVYLLPMDAKQVAMLGEAELARSRGLEAMLPDPSLADPDPARSANVPRDQQAFLQAYEEREASILAFLKQKRLVTIPSYVGHFYIRQLPEAFKPTSPGGFMNAPGVYDKDPSGFYFIPTYNARSPNFYIRAAIEEPRPILGHEGIPGHFLQLSIANHLSDEIRRHHDDGILIEGWALYTEEMMLRTGLYPPDSAGHGQVLRLARYRAARIGVDVNLQTGRWSFEQAVDYFMKAGGLDRESAEGEAAGAASSPTQKITYMVGKWQIMNLLGCYRDREGNSFELGRFHDQLIGYGSLPLSVVQWLMLDDSTALEQALRSF